MRRMVVLSAAWLLACDIEDIDHGVTDDDEQEFPARMAEAYCAQVFACDTCESGYASEAACVQAERTALEQMRTAARDAGMTFDGACVDKWIAQWEELGCTGETRAKHVYGEYYGPVGCQPYYGTVPEGEGPCGEIVGTGLSDCGQELTCYDERECHALGEPAECDCTEGMRCELVEGYPGCVPLVQLGEVCRLADTTLVGACPADAYCPFSLEADATCIAAAPLGASCDGGACASGACEDGVCVTPSPWICTEAFAPRQFR